MTYKLFTDGGSRGNPGPAAYAAVLKDSAGKIVNQVGVFIGKATNNEAEYKGLIFGLEMVSDMNITEIECFLDSELVVKQLKGEYKVKNEKIKEFFGTVKTRTGKFKNITFNHVPREQNSDADALVNKVLDSVELS